jgi:hypothetical protein
MLPTTATVMWLTLCSGEIIEGQSGVAMDNLGNYARIAG